MDLNTSGRSASVLISFSIGLSSASNNTGPACGTSFSLWLFSQCLATFSIEYESNPQLGHLYLTWSPMPMNVSSSFFILVLSNNCLTNCLQKLRVAWVVHGSTLT